MPIAQHRLKKSKSHDSFAEKPPNFENTWQTVAKCPEFDSLKMAAKNDEQSEVMNAGATDKKSAGSVFHLD